MSAHPQPSMSAHPQPSMSAHPQPSMHSFHATITVMQDDGAIDLKDFVSLIQKLNSLF